MSLSVAPDMLVYNDYVKEMKKARRAEMKKRKYKAEGEIEDIDSDDSFYSEIFFALANTKNVGYRIGKEVVSVQQNVDAADTTGGIVWESAYLLLDYVTQSSILDGDGKSVLDLGAGTGLLGLALSRLCSDVTVTEYDDGERNCNSVFELLRTNVTSHNEIFKDNVHVFPLDWNNMARDIRAWELSLDSGRSNVKFDLILGTDVLFSPSLVLPLLSTAASLIEASSGVCIFCMQVRCKDSHKIFLKEVSNFFEGFRDISEEVYMVKGCEWGKHVECFVYEMKGIKNRRMQDN